MAEIEDSEELESSVKGKQAELIVIGRLLEKGFTVYTPLIDVGTDCLVDVDGGNYKEIQVKYREDNPVFLARKFAPRENFYIICYLGIFAFGLNSPRSSGLGPIISIPRSSSLLFKSRTMLSAGRLLVGRGDA